MKYKIYFSYSKKNLIHSERASHPDQKITTPRVLINFRTEGDFFLERNWTNSSLLPFYMPFIQVEWE